MNVWTWLSTQAGGRHRLARAYRAAVRDAARANRDLARVGDALQGLDVDVTNLQNELQVQLGVSRRLAAQVVRERRIARGNMDVLAQHTRTVTELAELCAHSAATGHDPGDGVVTHLSLHRGPR